MLSPRRSNNEGGQIIHEHMAFEFCAEEEGETIFMVENRMGEDYHFFMDIQAAKDQIIPIIKKYHISRASLFGSIVTGKMHKGSDIDLLIELPEKATLFDMLGVKVDLEVQLGRKVDVVEYEGIKPFLKEDILSHQVLIYQQ